MSVKRNRDFVWKKDQTYRLIQIIRSNPVLWDTNEKDYKNRKLKTKVVSDIARRLGTSSEEILRKYHNLRCQMNNEIRKIKSDVECKIVWEYFDSLKFLVKYDYEKIAANITPKNTEDESQSTIDGSELFPKTLTHKPKLYSKKIKLDKTQNARVSETKTQDEDVFKSAIAALRLQKDDCDLFGEFVSVELRQIRSQARRQKLKRTIQRAIMAMAEEEENCNNYSSTLEHASVSSVNHSKTYLKASFDRDANKERDEVEICGLYSSTFENEFPITPEHHQSFHSPLDVISIKKEEEIILL